MSATQTTNRTAAPLDARSRSSRLREDLIMAWESRRAVILHGHTGDVFVDPERGNLVRLTEFTATVAAQQGIDFLHVDSRHGGRQINQPGDASTESPLSFRPAPMLELLNSVTHTLLRRPRPVVVYIDWSCLELAADNGDLLRTFLEVPTDPAFSGKGHQLVVVFKTERPPMQLTVMPGFSVLELGLPDAGERRYVMAQSDAHSPVPLEPGLTLADVATTLGGIEADGLLRTTYAARAGRPLSSNRIIQIKAAEIERVAGGTLVVDRSAPPNGLAGMAGLRYYLQSCLGADLQPGAILLAGGPGIGKTYSFLYMAHLMGLPAVRFGRLRAGIVGETEANFERARRSLEANAPAVLLMDEVDQAGLGKRGTNLDSGVSDRLRASILELTNAGPELGITFVMATNNPASIDPAALDRVLVVPCLHPSTNEAVEILLLAAEREGWTLDADAAREVLTRRGTLNTGRQLVRFLYRAARWAAGSGQPREISGDALRAAAADGLEVMDQPMQEFMGLSSLLLADSAEVFPWVAAARLGEPVEMPTYLTPLLDRNGQLDMSAVQTRVNQLRNAGHGFNA